MSRASTARWASLFLVGVLTACTGEVTATTSADSAPAPAETSATSPIPDGEMFGWVHGIEDGSLVMDPAELLTGDEARQAAVEEGVIGEGEDLPNDFFIRDPEGALITLPVASTASWRLLLFADGTPTETEVSIDEVLSALAGENPDVYGVVDGELPATVTVVGGEVTELVQTYLP